MKDTGKKTLENSQKEKQEWWLTDWSEAKSQWNNTFKVLE